MYFWSKMRKYVVILTYFNTKLNLVFILFRKDTDQFAWDELMNITIYKMNS